MLRNYRPEDVDQVLQIWLSASVQAHSFVEPAFWESKLEDMRNLYLPASETRVFENASDIAGFYSLFNDTLAAIFVSPEYQGKGIGTALLNDAKCKRQTLRLTVYKANRSSISFYEKQGFVVMDEQVDEHTGYPELAMEYRT
ncbi:N-acetyltransferase [Nitrincola iocasae]|uniref:N-acetyltransferase n=1 Tax=Nitrincola iocasae TaxID=2614693 RepID=A0A5J6L9P0_9GAMM|nr:N-acetyltransferase [Nitrincola iocasae]QEW05086.1 N-acetyltransferase [Nitrincola iocasae]